MGDWRCSVRRMTESHKRQKSLTLSDTQLNTHDSQSLKMLGFLDFFPINAHIQSKAFHLDFPLKTYPIYHLTFETRNQAKTHTALNHVTSSNSPLTTNRNHKTLCTTSSTKIPAKKEEEKSLQSSRELLHSGRSGTLRLTLVFTKKNNSL